jgi:hypothetical protein
MIMARFPLFLLGAISLLSGLLAGLSRLGLATPMAEAVGLHGPLMVCGFFGTVIGLERAVALRQAWTYAAPLFTGLGGLLLLAGMPLAMGAGGLLLGSLVFAAGGVWVAWRQPVPFTILMALGALAWAAGNCLWLLGEPLVAVIPAWMVFLAFTIAGERLELSRFLPPARWRQPFLLIVLIPLAVGLFSHFWLGLGIVGLAAWSLSADIARRTIRETGLARYVAVCVLSGYVWLAVSGLLLIAGGLPGGGTWHDAVLHAFFVGFVFAMVFGHAPIILPAVLRFDVPFTPFLYFHLGLLHISLLLRIIGDLAGIEAARMIGGVLNAAIIVLFLLTMLGRGLWSKFTSQA